MSTPAEVAACTAILRACDNPVVVELGAYQGEESDWIQTIPNVLHVAVEADWRNFKVMFGRKQRATYRLNAAIAEHDGLTELHLCEATGTRSSERGSSSIRKPTGHLEHFPWMSFNETAHVMAITLDTLAQLYVSDKSIDLLWVDIQGAERDMIKGGSKALARTRYMFIEAEEVEMYEGQATRPELLAMLPEWSIVQEFEYNLLLRNETLK